MSAALEGPVFHIGLPKTGTTFLQERFFPHLKLPFYTTHRGALPASMAWVFRLNGRWLPDWMPRPDRVRALAAAVAREVRAVPELSQGTAVVSAEGLCGVSHDPLLNSGVIARRLAATHPRVRAVICVRDHADWCESIYRQLVIREDRFGRFIPFDRFFATESGASAVTHVSDLRWSELCREWIEALGADRVLVLRYERLRDDPVGFLAELTRFISGRAPDEIDTSIRVNDSSGLDAHCATPLARKLARLAGAVALANGARAYWEARTIPLALRDRLRSRGEFKGIDAATRARIAECARPDRERLDAILAR